MERISPETMRAIRERAAEQREELALALARNRAQRRRAADLRTRVRELRAEVRRRRPAASPASADARPDATHQQRPEGAP